MAAYHTGLFDNDTAQDFLELYPELPDSPSDPGVSEGQLKARKDRGAAEIEAR